MCAAGLAGAGETMDATHVLMRDEGVFGLDVAVYGMRGFCHVLSDDGIRLMRRAVVALPCPNHIFKQRRGRNPPQARRRRGDLGVRAAGAMSANRSPVLW